MRFGFAIVQLQRTDSSVPDVRVRFERRHVSIGQPKPRFRYPRPRAAEFRIFLKRAMEKLETFSQCILGAFVGIKETLQVIVIRFRAAKRRRRRYRELEFERIDDGARDLIL